MAPCIDRLESRLLLSTAVMSVHEAAQAHHQHPVRQHHPAEVWRTHSGHHGATPDTSTGFQVVAQFNNAAFEATVAIADNDIWAVGTSNPGTSEVPLAVHFNGTSWSNITSPIPGGGLRGVTALSDGTVVAVGGGTILEN
jgi:hypothetical protein